MLSYDRVFVQRTTSRWFSEYSPKIEQFVFCRQRFGKKKKSSSAGIFWSHLDATLRLLHEIPKRAKSEHCFQFTIEENALDVFSKSIKAVVDDLSLLKPGEQISIDDFIENWDRQLKVEAAKDAKSKVEKPIQVATQIRVDPIVPVQKVEDPIADKQPQDSDVTDVDQDAIFEGEFHHDEISDSMKAREIIRSNRKKLGCDLIGTPVLVTLKSGMNRFGVVVSGSVTPLILQGAKTLVKETPCGVMLLEEPNAGMTGTMSCIANHLGLFGGDFKRWFFDPLMVNKYRDFVLRMSSNIPVFVSGTKTDGKETRSKAGPKKLTLGTPISDADKAEMIDILRSLVPENMTMSVYDHVQNKKYVLDSETVVRVEGNTDVKKQEFESKVEVEETIPAITNLPVQKQEVQPATPVSEPNDELIELVKAREEIKAQKSRADKAEVDKVRVEKKLDDVENERRTIQKELNSANAEIIKLNVQLGEVRHQLSEKSKSWFFRRG